MGNNGWSLMVTKCVRFLTILNKTVVKVSDKPLTVPPNSKVTSTMSNKPQTKPKPKVVTQSELRQAMNQLKSITNNVNKNKNNNSNNKNKKQKNKNKNYKGPKNPVFSRKGHVETRSEFIKDIVVPYSNSMPFTMLVSESINPGNATVFPWLSQIAAKYDKYKFNSLSFTYKKMVSEYNLSGTKGKVLYAFDYDASDFQVNDKRGMEDTTTKADGMASQTMTMTCIPKELHKNSNAKFVRSGPVPSQASILDYDCGQVWVAVEGIPVEEGKLYSKIGELWVNYDVELSVPVLENATQMPTNRVFTQFPHTNYFQVANPGAWRQMLFALPNEWPLNSGNYDGLGLVTDQNVHPSWFNLPPGVYQITLGSHLDDIDTGLTSNFGINLHRVKRGGNFSDATVAVTQATVAHYLPVETGNGTADVQIDELDISMTVCYIEDGTWTLFGAYETDTVNSQARIHNYMTIIAL